MDADCPAGRWCDSGTCRTQREQGMPCERTAQCGTGFCTDGVCCNMACKDACYACNVAGELGVCKAIATGQDPDNECPVQAIGTCGNLGGCNGRGACVQASGGNVLWLRQLHEPHPVRHEHLRRHGRLPARPRHELRQLRLQRQPGLLDRLREQRPVRPRPHL